jgi:hypothetical protein
MPAGVAGTAKGPTLKSCEFERVPHLLAVCVVPGHDHALDSTLWYFSMAKYEARKVSLDLLNLCIIFGLQNASTPRGML